MKIIVGLGNPGRKYDRTPHNLGFEVADELARRWGLRLLENVRAQAQLAEGRIADQAVILMKPLTFMNLSGDAVAPLARQRELGADDLLVITDDVTLPIGRLRQRPGGSAGGHNGLKSLIERLGTQEFPRLRVGIQPEWPIQNLVQFVLAKLPPHERAQLDEMAGVAADAAELWLKQGSAAVTEAYNGYRRFPPGGGK